MQAENDNLKNMMNQMKQKIDDRKQENSKTPKSNEVENEEL